jgi:hypothetical protein
MIVDINPGIPGVNVHDDFLAPVGVRIVPVGAGPAAALRSAVGRREPGRAGKEPGKRRERDGKISTGPGVLARVLRP